MGLFDFLGEFLDSTEETIKDTSKNIIEKTPGLVSSAGKIALDAAQRGMIEAGKKISQFQEVKKCENQETEM